MYFNIAIRRWCTFEDLLQQSEAGDRAFAQVEIQEACGVDDDEERGKQLPPIALWRKELFDVVWQGVGAHHDR